MEDPKIEKILEIIERLYEEVAGERDAYIEGYRDALDCLRGEMYEDDSLTPRDGVAPNTFYPGQNLLVPLTGGEIPKNCKWDEEDLRDVPRHKLLVAIDIDDDPEATHGHRPSFRAG